MVRGTEFLLRSQRSGEGFTLLDRVELFFARSSGEERSRKHGGTQKFWENESRGWVWEIHAMDDEELNITKLFRHLEVSSNHHLTSEDLPNPLGILVSLSISNCSLAFPLTCKMFFPVRA